MNTAKEIAATPSAGRIKPAPLLPVTHEDTSPRPRAAGKFLFAGSEKLYVRGVTYGPFRPDADGCEFRDPALAAHDFAWMAAHGMNAVRTYTLPPKWLLDTAHKNNLRVLVGLPWEQHITFLDSSRRARDL